MPSSQAPPAGATALDPTAVRPDIADARIVRVTPAEVRATLSRLRDEGFPRLLAVGGGDYPGREPARFDVVYHLLRMPVQIATVAEVGTPERVRVLCGVPEENAVVPTMSDLCPNTSSTRREIFDLSGM